MNKRKPRIVTTSWDDGHPADLRVAEVLYTHGLSGTFYVPLTGYRGWPTLAGHDLRAMTGEGFEIGAHSVSHRTLRGLPEAEIASEVRDSKAAIEAVVGREVGVFCYPRGRYDLSVLRQVRAAGYWGARTTRLMATSLKFKRFEMPASLQVFPHTEWAYLRNMTKARSPRRILRYLALRGEGDWVDLGKRLFDRVMNEGGVWHLFGHSWEIDQKELWGGLEELAEYVSQRPGVQYLTNGELLHLQKAGQ